MPISDCEVRDPRIRRTRQSLQRALQTLLDKKSFDEISVQDVTETAEINRATFYDHYTDKFALLDALIAGGFHRLLQERKVSYDGTCPSAANAIVMAVCDWLTQSETQPAKSQNQCAFQPLVDAAITHAIRGVLQQGMPPTAPGALSSALIAASASSAIYGAVKEWSTTPNRPPAEAIVPSIVELVLPILFSPDRSVSKRKLHAR